MLPLFLKKALCIKKKGYFHQLSKTCFIVIGIIIITIMIIIISVSQNLWSSSALWGAGLSKHHDALDKSASRTFVKILAFPSKTNFCRSSAETMISSSKQIPQQSKWHCSKSAHNNKHDLYTPFALLHVAFAKLPFFQLIKILLFSQIFGL